MSKPQLPEVPQKIREKAYKASGKCPSRALFLMLGFGIPLAMVIGIIGNYGGFLVTALAALLAGIFIFVARGCFSFLALIASIILMGAVGLLYPALIGAAIGYTTWLLAKRGKCRSEGKAGTIGFMNGVVGYGAFIFIAVQTHGQIHTTSWLDVIYYQSTDIPWWIYMLIGLDALIFTSVAAIIALSEVANTPFCETCEEWYGDEQQEIFAPALTESLLQTLETGAIQELESNLVRVSTTDYPHLSLKMQKCPTCTIADSQLSVALHWQEEKIEKGQKKVENKSELWFKTMMSAELGKQLNELIFVKK